MIRELFETGVDVFRLNFSHGKQEDHGKRLQVIRRLEEEYQYPISVMADLQGPKLRLGTFENGPVRLTIGQKFRLDSDPTPGDATRVGLPHPEVMEVLTPGTVMLLDDGKVRLRVEDSGDGWAAAVVEAGTQLSDRKGLNVPNALLRLSPLTPKDRADLEIGRAHV